MLLNLIFFAAWGAALYAAAYGANILLDRLDNDADKE